MSARPALKARVLVVLALVLAAARAAADSPFVEFLRPDPRFVAAASRQGFLAMDELEDLALEASGVGSQALPAYRARFDSVCAELASAVDRAVPPATGPSGAASGPGADDGEAARAEAALAWLHDHVLKSYSFDTTTIDALLDTGRFNCVSSAVLYVVALRGLGIQASGARTQDHAFVVVHAGGRDIDVETTNRYGFDPGKRKEFQDSFGRVTGFNYVPPGNYRDRQAIGERELIALVISNRIATAEQAGDFRGALRLGSDYNALLGATAEGRTEGRKILLDCVNNLCASLQTRQDWNSIEDLVATARGILGADPRLDGLLATAVHNRLVPLVGGTAWRTGVEAADSALRDGSIDASIWFELVAYAYGLAAQRTGQAGDWLAAAALADEGLARVTARGNGTSAAASKARADLVRAGEVARRNYVVTVHNRFAALYNRGDYAGAAAAIEEALARMPGDATLADDLAAAKRALKR